MAAGKLLKRIRFIVRGYSLYLKFRTLGITALTKVERRKLMTLGLVKKEDLASPTITDAYLSSHLSLLRKPESRKKIRDYAIKHINSTAGELIDRFVEKAVADLVTVASQGLLAHRNQVIAQTRQSLAEGFGVKTTKAIAAELREKTGELYKDWDRVCCTELARATNLGALDAIVESNHGVSPDEIYVYCSGPDDHKKCQHCRRFWLHTDGSPRVYKLSTLLNNGSNVGRKAADWLPTLPPSHPNCRDVLLQLPIGWGFVSGRIHYKGRGHEEWQSQKKDVP